MHPAAFLARKWRLSYHGNQYLQLQGITVVVFGGRHDLWYYQVAGEYSPCGYLTERQAKLAAFTAFQEALRRRTLHRQHTTDR
ncbi:MAG TPA: hypothetical protein VHK63_05215 [Candidatus Limnocylindria bacterium]|nr:hypothetical protein [Candidatus Limnocylindria bacterium]